MAHRAAAVFGIDVRSLAAFRISTALLLLADLWYRGQEISAFFTDRGILPRDARIGLTALSGEFGFRHQWSLHMYNGEYWAQLLLMLTAALFAVWLLLGYRTRLAAVASWVLLLSLDGRNPAILDSGDVLLRCMLFWSLFTPLGGRASLDALLSRPRGTLAGTIASPATVALLLQLAMMYFFSAIMKTHPAWHTEFSAVYYALNCDEFATPLGIAVREYPRVMMALTAGAYLLELLVPVAVFSPVWTGRIRLAAIASFWLFHVGLGLTLELGLFPLICMAAWLVYLPAGFWDGLARRLAGSRLERFVRRFAARLVLLSGNPQFPLFRRPEPTGRSPSRFAAWTAHAVVIVLLLYVALWNVRESDMRYWESRVLPRQFNGIARALGLDQNWGMFSPIPRTEDGWLIMKGTLRDGSEVNLWDPGQPLPWEKPALVSATYRTQRWRKYLDNLTLDAYGGYRSYFCEWLARCWNDRYASQDKQKQVVTVELIHQVEHTPPPGEPIYEAEASWLYTYYPLYYD